MILNDIPVSHEAQYDLELPLQRTVTPLDPAPVNVALQEPSVAVKVKPTGGAPLPKAMPSAPTPVPVGQRFAARKPIIQDKTGHVHLFSNQFGGVDLAAELSAAISMRMAPPPEPSLDPRFMYFGLFGGMVLGLAAWCLGVLSSSSWLPYVALSGGAMLAFGLLWRAYLSSRNGHWLTGLATILPPVCFVQLLRPVGQHGRKPLAFVVVGIALIGLFLVGPQAKAYIDANIGEKTAEFKITTKTPGNLDSDSFKTASADEQAEFLKSLEVEARSAVTPASRQKALEALVSLAPDEGIPLAVERLSEFSDRDHARTQLLQQGIKAEPAVLKLLSSTAESQQLLACGLLEKIGTAQSYQALRDLAEATNSRAVRVESALAADAILKRMESKTR